MKTLMDIQSKAYEGSRSFFSTSIIRLNFKWRVTTINPTRPHQLLLLLLHFQHFTSALLLLNLPHPFNVFVSSKFPFSFVIFFFFTEGIGAVSISSFCVSTISFLLSSSCCLLVSIRECANPVVFPIFLVQISIV